MKARKTYLHLTGLVAFHPDFTRHLLLVLGEPFMPYGLLRYERLIGTGLLEDEYQRGRVYIKMLAR